MTTTKIKTTGSEGGDRDLTRNEGAAPGEDAPGISQSSENRCSLSSTPEMRATGRVEGGSEPGDAENALYDPLHNCPAEKRGRYEGTARQARDGSFTKAIKLMCLECVGWEYPEAKRCQTFTCALWAFNRRLFRGRNARARKAA